MDEGTPVVVAFPDGEDNWRIVETGLHGSLDVHAGVFVIPFEDDVTAEEVSRILTGMIKRETETDADDR